ncbi:MAG: glycosyltransferase family 2 protein [Steroidobacteraceae bacterium]
MGDSWGSRSAQCTRLAWSFQENKMNADHAGVEIPRGNFSLTCVVPVYNEEPHIRRLLWALHRCISEMTSRVEIIVIDDGSTDRSREEILQAAKTLPIHYLAFSRNFGKEFAIQAGLDAAQGDCVIILDGDFQHPLAALPAMVCRWKAGADMVYAVPANRGHDSPIKRLASRIYYRWLVPRSALRIPANAGDFRLLDRKVVEALRALPERNRYMKGLYA